MNDTYKIREIGGCLMVTIPRKVSEVLKLKAGDDVTIRVGVSTMTIEHAKKVKSRAKG